jgi:phosphatidylserine decarboxylase
MRIHKEGLKTIIFTGCLIGIILFLIYYFPIPFYIQYPVILLSAGFYFLIFYFFRNPHRSVLNIDNNLVYAPADGMVVVIEETDEPEYLKRKCIQVSIFMSPLNVHVNRYAVGGTVQYCKYHPGKYLVAWHPKSSLLNERSTIVLKTDSGKEILIRQIAGAVARRIVTYSKEGTMVAQGNDLGFIKFGSRVDVFLPLAAKISVQPNQKVKGNLTVLATI